MGTADGAVLGTTKIVDHGPDSLRWNLVILAEGFTAAEQDAYHLAASRLVDKLFATQPFRQMWCAINVHRVDIRSDESGADDPVCPDVAGAGTTVRTFFDATFCNRNLSRLAHGSEPLAVATATAAVPQMRATVVIVNSTKYGGAGGQAAWYTLAPAAQEIAIHEMGHAAFGLADEYGAGANTVWAGGESPQPNVTSRTGRTTTKWASRIDAATPLPTQENPGCSQHNPAASPVPAGTIGLFAGGRENYCGIYHPEHICRMRVLDNDFCKICSEAIIATLRPHLPQFSGPVNGRQFQGTLGPRQTRRWFTYDWPACYHVLWSVIPTSPVTSSAGVSWKVQVERATRERITYWISITNETDQSIDIDGRYQILARV